MKVAMCCGRRQKMYRHGRSKASTQQRRAAGCIWSLPEELLLHLLKGLHISDLLNMRSTHPTFRNLIDKHPVVWTTACFKDAWPTLPNMKHLNKAAEHGNVEALIKLGIAYLYNEGLPSDFQGKKVTTNGEHAAEMFCKVETLLPHVTPFTWLFIRPPWATSGACCKECVFRNMKNYTQTYNVPNVTVCIAKTLQLLEDETLQLQAVEHLELAMRSGSPHAAYLLWQHRYTKHALDSAVQLEAIRSLRNQVGLGDPDAVLQLCRFYVQNKYGGFSEMQAAMYTRHFIQSSIPNHIEEIYRQSELTHSMRYILVDWLVEVAGMKDFGSSTLHAAISVVDRFLRIHRTSRARFQLLGVAAMVLCSRFLGKDIITIREAAWLTDNTYKYEDVVRMMGEIMAALRGTIRVFCSLDYVQLIGLLAKNDAQTQCLAEYVCELALLQSDLGPFPQAEIAACAVLLARLSQKLEFPWPQKMLQFTGYSVSYLSNGTMQILEKCFLEGAMVDHRAVVLQAVKQRYAEEAFYHVSATKMPTADALRALLGMHESVPSLVDLRVHRSAMPNLIMSPSRNKNGHANRPCQMSVEREQAATPTPVSTLEKGLDGLLNDSHLSGYDGDLEDELDSFVEESEADSSACLDDTSSSAVSDSPDHPPPPSGWLGSDTSCSFSPLLRMPVSASTPSIRINLPSFGYISSSPVSQCRYQGSPAAPPPGRLANLSVSRLRHAASARGCAVQPHPVSAPLRALRSTPVALCLRKDVGPPGGEQQADSGIDLTGHFEQGASPLHDTSATTSMVGDNRSGVKQRKRRSSNQLNNENKTHVISL